MKIILDLFAPLLEATEDTDGMIALLWELGWQIELNDDQADALRVAMALPTQLETLATILADIIETRTITVAQAELLITTAREIFEVIEGYATGDTLGALTEVPAPFNVFTEGGDWEEMALRLPDYLITSWLHNYYTPLYEGLFALDLISETPRVPVDGAPAAQQSIIRAINWTRLEPTLTDPITEIAAAYNWEDGFDVAKALTNLSRILASVGIHPGYRPMRQTLAENWMASYNGPEAIEYEAVIFNKSSRNTSGGSAQAQASLILGTLGTAAGLEGIALTNTLSGQIAESEPLAEGINLVMSASGNADGALDFRMRPSGLEVVPGGAESSLRIALEGRPEKPWRLIGEEGKAGIALNQFTVSAETLLSTTEQDISFAATTSGAQQGLSIIIAPGDGDGFVSEIFGDVEFAVSGDVGAQWSKSGGFRFDAGLGFDVRIPIDLTLGPLNIDNLHLVLQAGLDGVTLDAAVTGGLDIAVMQVSVEDIGLRADLKPVPQNEQPGNIGPLDLGLSFLPPKGMGLTINAGDLVTGGGYLFHDAEAGEYAGVGQIAFTQFKLTAIGMLVTKMPDNQPGWSLFLSVFSEFPPLQLGFGITLNGVGGLMGLHRTFDDEALRDRLKDGALESIMFPPDPIANAPQILDDLRAIFPVSQGQFVFGVMCRLGWGTPRLITADIGVIIEFPDPIKIALLGRIGVAIPDPDFAIVELNMDVFGVVNITEKTFALDATLRDSHVLNLFQLSGDMAMRMSWGDQPNVLISMGGFHPDFVPPVGTPTLARLRAALPLGDKASVELTAYTAITSNTFQAGGRLDIWVRVAGFNAEGWFSFDALIQFDPFGFIFQVTFGVSVSKGSTTLLGVDVVATVTGPGLWTVNGRASFRFLGFKKSINVSISVGADESEPPSLTDVAVLVLESLTKPEALEIVAASDRESPVVLLETDGITEVLPWDVVTLQQKIAPFDLTLEKYGTGGIVGNTTFAYDTVQLGTAEPLAVESDMVRNEWFAPAEFQDMTDDEKLTTPSYQEYTAGVAVSPSGQEVSPTQSVAHSFETVILDPEFNQKKELTDHPIAFAARGDGPRRGHRARVIRAKRKTAVMAKTAAAVPPTQNDTTIKPAYGLKTSPMRRSGA